MSVENLKTLSEFENLCQRIIDEKGALQLCDYAIGLNLENHMDKADLTIFAVTHGNEVVGAHIVNKILGEILSGDLTIDKKVQIAHSNVEAFKLNQRCVVNDMNRTFGCKEPKTVDELRSQQLMGLLDNTRWLIDIHQTIYPTSTPFYIAKEDPKNFKACQMVDDGFPIIKMQDGFSADGKTTIEYLHEIGGNGFVVELGDKGYRDELLNAGYNIVKSLLLSELPTDDNLDSFKDTKDLYKFEYFYIQPDETHPAHLKEGFENFQSVKAGDIMGSVDGEPIEAPIDGKVIFPKYDEYQKAAKDLYGIIIPL